MRDSKSEIQNQIPGIGFILGGVNTKTAVYAAWNSINPLINTPDSADKWEQVQVLTKTYLVPRGFRVSVGNRSTQFDVVGSGRDTFIQHLTANLDISGSYGGFSGTLNSSFGMTEDRTEAYAFGTHTYQYELYTLSAPTGVRFDSEFWDPQFAADLESMSPAEFYNTYGTHYTSSIMMGVKSSLSLYSLFKSQYSADTFSMDLSAAYNTIAGSFKTSGGFKYCPYQAKTGCTTSAGGRRTRLAPPGIVPALS
jgi:hypothetical protein